MIVVIEDLEDGGSEFQGSASEAVTEITIVGIGPQGPTGSGGIETIAGVSPDGDHDVPVEGLRDALGVDALELDLLGETTEREQAVQGLGTAINAEVQARTEADVEIISDLNTEITARTSAGVTLQTNIDAEAAVRAESDADLHERIDAIEEGGGDGVSLGETSSTAYRGDRGKIAYDHSQETGNPHDTTANDVGAATTAQGDLADSAVQPGDLAEVATSGEYEDLLNKPVRRVSTFVDGTDDLSGGDFTTLHMVGGQELPRFYATLIDLTVLAVDGDDFGVWQITPSGPCTPLASLTLGESIVSGFGYSAIAYTLDGATVAGVRILAIADAPGTVPEALLMGLLEGQGARMNPSRWLTCKEGDPWAVTTTLPTPSSSVRVRSLMRINTSDDTSSGDIDFAHIYNEVHSGAFGGDLIELAISSAREGPRFFFEAMDVNADRESSYYDDESSGNANLVPVATWIELEIEVDFASGVFTWRVRTDMSWDYVDPDDGTLWRTVRVWTYPGGAFQLADSEGVEQHIGEGQTLTDFDVASLKRWDDGVLVVDMDPSDSDIGDVSIADSKLESSPGVPAVWDASGDNNVQGIVVDGVDESLLLPDPASLPDNDMVVTDSGLWVARAPIQVRTSLGLGDASTKDVGTGSGDVAAGDDSRFTNARTPTAHAATHADGGTDEIAIDASQVTTGTLSALRLPVSVPLQVRLASDHALNQSNTTLQDTGLAVTVAANTAYIIEAWVAYEGADANMDIKFGLSYPGSSVGAWSAQGMITTGTASNAGLVNNADALTTVYSRATIANIRVMCSISGSILTDGTSGTFKIQAAQNTSTAANLTIGAHSWLRLTPVI